jgi:1-acyl-sn-glycerol-3-phosphate acyltransferase
MWYWSVTAICVFAHFFIALFCIFTPNFFKNHRKLSKLAIQIIASSMKLKVITHGTHHIPKDRACIFMANHTSLIDILVMVIGVPDHFNFIAKKELFWVPFIGLDMLFGGDFLIDRNNPRKAKDCLNKVEKRLKKGWNMLIFPEGTRSKTGDLLPFKRGAFKLAVDSNAFIIPCYIDGSQNIVQKNSLKASPGNVHIHFGAPIEPDHSLEPKKNIDHLINITFQRIQHMKDQSRD